ncbi:MAG: hypothetical protein JW944_12775 [Deltaproteobacteria bacterium]|nr:hypothetical protein [Deltaproteobacteria bacterium]
MNISSRYFDSIFIILLTIVPFIMIGCTTLKTVEMPQNSVQERISAGDLIDPGDRIKIITNDGKEYEFKVTSVEAGYVKGKDVEISIRDIALVEKRKISIGKTALLSGAAFLLFIMSQFGNGP